MTRLEEDCGRRSSAADETMLSVVPGTTFLLTRMDLGRRTMCGRYRLIDQNCVSEQSRAENEKSGHTSSRSQASSTGRRFGQGAGAAWPCFHVRRAGPVNGLYPGPLQFMSPTVQAFWQRSSLFLQLLRQDP